MPPVLLAWLVILSAVVLTPELQRQLLLARALSAIIMLLIWQFLLSTELQLKAMSCAIVYHGLAEGLRQWQRNFPCVFEHQKNRKMILLAVVLGSGVYMGCHHWGEEHDKEESERNRTGEKYESSISRVRYSAELFMEKSRDNDPCIWP
ncbi:unnamed protein product [Peronospora destructor]|uniref:Uncharacterized protein n=1 Tax=Peronospora destructor TaxID=86335 RepID=A0AAV0V4L0_9STRA|nr:unnamed protein product [Peronospora destructor]